MWNYIHTINVVSYIHTGNFLEEVLYSLPQVILVQESRSMQSDHCHDANKPVQT